MTWGSSVHVCDGPLSLAISDFWVYCLLFCESVHFYCLRVLLRHLCGLHLVWLYMS